MDERQKSGLEPDGPIAEIIGRPPIWIVRWGITVLLAGVLGLLILAWAIRYPDVIAAPVTLTATHPPVKVVARGGGEIAAFFVGDGERVAAGRDLALLANRADLADVRYLTDLLTRHEPRLQRGEAPDTVSWRKHLALGEIQVAYADLLASCADLAAYDVEAHAPQKLRAAHGQREDYKLLAGQLQRQVGILTREQALAAEKFANYQRLFERGLVSESDLHAAEEHLLAKRRAAENAASDQANHRVRTAELAQRILELEQNHAQTRRRLREAIRKGFKALRAEIERWEHRCLLKAPVTGKVSFFKFWSPGQYVRAGDEVFTLVPADGDLVAKVYLPQRGAGKVTVGQRVNLKWDGFPYRQYGMVVGRVDGISPVAEGDAYLIDIHLERGPVTTYGKRLSVRYDMRGTAEIVTERMRLIERVLTPIRTLFSSNPKGA